MCHLLVHIGLNAMHSASRADGAVRSISALTASFDFACRRHVSPTTRTLAGVDDGKDTQRGGGGLTAWTKTTNCWAQCAAGHIVTAAQRVSPLF